MKAADIPDDTFLAIVREFNEGRAPDKVISWAGGEDVYINGVNVTIRPPDYTVTGPRWALIWDLTDRLPDVPEKVIRAKAAKLIRRGLLQGCTCGCRGDFCVPGTPWWIDPDEGINRVIDRVWAES